MQQGYHGTGLKEILDAVQIPKGSFYNYFGSKENFAAEVIQHYINPFIDQLSDHLQNSDKDDLLVNLWQGALLRMKIEQSSTPLKQCCENLLGDFFKA